MLSQHTGVCMVVAPALFVLSFPRGCFDSLLHPEAPGQCVIGTPSTRASSGAGSWGTLGMRECFGPVMT